MGDKTADVWQGTLALMVLKTLETVGPQHGYGIARRIEQISGNIPLAELWNALSRVVEAGAGEGAIVSEWGLSEQPTCKGLKFYKLTRAGRKQIERETRDWEQATAILARFLAPVRQE